MVVLVAAKHGFFFRMAKTLFIGSRSGQYGGRKMTLGLLIICHPVVLFFGGKPGIIEDDSRFMP